MIMFFKSYILRSCDLVNRVFWKQMEDYVLFEQMISEILKEGNKGDGATMAPSATSGTEARIVGTKHW